LPEFLPAIFASITDEKAPPDVFIRVKFKEEDDEEEDEEEEDDEDDDE